MTRKRIIFVIDNLGSGGAQRQIVNLALGLSAVGHDCIVFTYSLDLGHFTSEFKGSNIRLVNYPRAICHPVSTAWKLRRLVKAVNADVLVAFMPAPSFISCLALTAFPRLKLIVSERSTFRFGRPLLGDRLQRALHRRADLVTTNSLNQAQLIRANFPHLSSRILTIYNGFKLNKFCATETRNETGEFTIVAVGRITPGKNIANLVRAVASARHQGLAVRLDWIGRLDDDQWATGYYREISAVIDTTGIGSGWRWLGERKDVMELLTSYDALIHPSLFEGLPNAVCEAFAAGIPVLASNVCDHPILVESPVRGLLFDPERPESISRSLLQFAELPLEVRRAMGLAARAYFERELSMDRMCAAYAALL